jgi:hypothetical protein
VAVALSTVATLLFGIVFPLTQELSSRAHIAATPSLPAIETTPTASISQNLPIDSLAP